MFRLRSPHSPPRSPRSPKLPGSPHPAAAAAAAAAAATSVRGIPQPPPPPACCSEAVSREQQGGVGGNLVLADPPKGRLRVRSEPGNRAPQQPDDAELQRALELSRISLHGEKNVEI